jgi:hypothetical protein
MSIKNSLLRRIINEELMLFEKDINRIVSRLNKNVKGSQSSGAIGLFHGADDHGTYSIRDANKDRVFNEKELKRIWADEVKAAGSRKFFDEDVIKIHRINAFAQGLRGGDPFQAVIKFINDYSKGKNKDEISCFGYSSPSAISTSPRNDLPGLLLKGYTTWASNIDSATHMTSMATPEDRKKHAGSGLHKRPILFTDEFNAIATQMIVDKESFHNVASEMVVDNWVISGVVLPIQDMYQKTIDDLKKNFKKL